MSIALELRGLHKSFGASHIIRGASLQAEAGERLAIIGPNGAGKSTLFHLISGRITPSGGDILLHGKPIQHLPPYQIRRLGLSRSFQINNVFGNLSVWENLRCALLWAFGYRYAFWRWLDHLHDVRQRAEEVLEITGLQGCRDVPAAQLSYAQLRALEIGLAIAADASVLLLDEPTAGMSRAETAQAVDLIRRVSAGKTLLMVEHDMDVVFDLADRIAVLVYGEVIACDTPQAIRANPLVQQAYLGSLDGEGA